MFLFLFVCLLQDKVEEADSSRARVAGWNWELRGPAEDVPVPLLLPAKSGVEPRPRRGPLPLQGALRAPTGLAETARTADPAARAAGGQRSSPAAAPASAPHVGRASSARSAVSGPLVGVWGGRECVCVCVCVCVWGGGCLTPPPIWTPIERRNKPRRAQERNSGTIPELCPARNHRFIGWTWKGWFCLFLDASFIYYLFIFASATQSIYVFIWSQSQYFLVVYPKIGKAVDSTWPQVQCQLDHYYYYYYYYYFWVFHCGKGRNEPCNLL